jgi:SAM-dependent methyltransferase
MSTSAIFRTRESAVDTTGPAIWDRAWRHQPSVAKDEVLLDRERRNPRWAWIHKRIESAFGEVRGLRTIELGSGRGDLSVLLAERGADVTLLDASELGLEQAKQRFDRLGLSGRFVRSDLFDPLGSGLRPFDVALSSGVIEHFTAKDRMRSVAAHLSALRPGGVVAISVPHAWCVPYRVWKWYLGFRGWWPYGMELPYSRLELARLGRAVGLDDVETQCTGLWQSIGDHWVRRLTGRRPDWIGRASCLDGVLGFTLLMTGRRPLQSPRESAMETG